MGDPKKARKKYSTPVHPWEKERIEEERELKKEYGLGKKKEIMIAKSVLKRYKNIAKRLIVSKTEQGAKEKKQVLDKLQRLGILSGVAELDTILGLTTKDVLERRLQSVVYRQGLTRTMKQARQFITHRHLTIGDKEITSPSYLISLEEETKLGFKAKSALADADHPERAVLEKNVPVEEVKEGETPAKEEKKPATKDKKPKVKILPEDDTGDDLEVAEVEPVVEAPAEEVKEEEKEAKTTEEKVVKVKEPATEVGGSEASATPQSEKKEETPVAEDKPVEDKK